MTKMKVVKNPEDKVIEIIRRLTAGYIILRQMCLDELDLIDADSPKDFPRIRFISKISDEIKDSLTFSEGALND